MLYTWDLIPGYSRSSSAAAFERGACRYVTGWMHIYIYYLYCSILGLFCFALPPSSIMRCLAPPLLHLLYTATPNSLSRVLVMLLLLLVAVCCRCRHRSTAVRRHNTPTNMRYTFCKMNKGFILRCTRYLHDACCVLCSKTTAGLPGGLVGCLLYTSPSPRD